MQVHSGKYKRRKLVFPKDPTVRPTKQIVRESVFNILQPYIEGSSFLDLCAGVGGMGIEAVSRGAEKVVFVDKDISYLKRNLQFVEEDVTVFRGTVDQFFTRNKDRFDIIYFDPPWDDRALYQKSLKRIFDFDILKSKGFLVCEYRASLSDLLDDLPCTYKTYTYGSSAIAVFET